MSQRQFKKVAFGERVSGGRRRLRVTARKRALALGDCIIITMAAVASEIPPDTLTPTLLFQHFHGTQ